jgi:hypothetical protein
MLLFQIHNFNLSHHIKNLDVKIKQVQDKFKVDSNYIRGDYRTEKNQISSTTFSIKGLVESQHFIHALQSIQENDGEGGLIKCFFIEKYLNKNENYQGNKQPSKSFRFSFQYCYIDIIAINQVDTCRSDGKVFYDVDFEISLKNNTTYDITNSKNSFLVTDTILRTVGINRYDTNLLYDSGLRYDTFLQSIQINSLFNQKDKLENWEKSLTCCDQENTYINHIDTVIRPFYYENASSRAGLITNYIDNSSFVFNEEPKNFLQVKISNPYNNLIQNLNSIETNILLQRQAVSHTITNLDITSNTYTTNAIIQIFNLGYNSANDQLISGNTNNVFSFLNQKITIQIKNDLGEISNLSIECTSNFILNNLKMLIIHPHRQLVFGVFDTVTATFTTSAFNLETLKLFNLENSMLQNQIKVTNENLDGVQEWFRLSPRFANSYFEIKGKDSIKFSTQFANQSQIIANNTALVCQIYSLTENNLI